MSADRVRTGSQPGVDCPAELTFEGCVAMADGYDVRVHGRRGVVDDDHRRGDRVVRFNWAVRVHADTLRVIDGQLAVDATRLARRGDVLVPTFDVVTLTWRELDWMSWRPKSPDGTWVKVL